MGSPKWMGSSNCGSVTNDGASSEIVVRLEYNLLDSSSHVVTFDLLPRCLTNGQSLPVGSRTYSYRGDAKRSGPKGFITKISTIRCLQQSGFQHWRLQFGKYFFCQIPLGFPRFGQCYRPLLGFFLQQIPVQSRSLLAVAWPCRFVWTLRSWASQNLNRQTDRRIWFSSFLFDRFG